MKDSPESAPYTIRVPALMDEDPILVYPNLARALGLNEALIVQQIYFYMNVHRRKKSERHFIDDRWWVYNSYPEWIKEHFPWLSVRGLQKIILKLEKMNILMSMQGVENRQDRRKWYSVNLEALDKLVNTSKLDSTQSVRSRHTKGTLKTHKVGVVYTETTTETTQREKESAAPVGTDVISEDDLVVQGQALLENAFAETQEPQPEEIALPVEAALEPPTQPSETLDLDLLLPEPRDKSSSPRPKKPLIEAACFAFNEAQGPFTAKLGQWFLGTLKKKGKNSDAWFEWKPDPSLTPDLVPQQIIAFTLWYANHDKFKDSFAEHKSLPQTPSILRDHWDKYIARGADVHTFWMGQAKPILERLLKGESVKPHEIKVIRVKTPTMPVESAQAYKSINTTHDAAYTDRREEGTLDLAAEILGG